MDDFGTPDGIFGSDLFASGESWTYQFDSPGTFHYYCSIHPWMEGVAVVEEKIPSYPHDAAGMLLEFPLLQYTPDMDIEVNLA